MPDSVLHNDFNDLRSGMRMFRFAARNEKAVKPFKTNDHAKSLIAFRFAGPKTFFRVRGFGFRRRPISAMGPNERKKVARKRS
jgi:hypothetical protein